MLSASTSPSSPARSAFQVCADLLYPPEHAYVDDPVGYAKDVLGFKAWSVQARILEAVRDHPRVAVRSSHGPGKTATAAQAALWFLRTHPDSRVITTAPTWAQVEQLLWREIRAAVARASDGEFPKPAATKLELGDQWFAIGLSTNEPERFQGHHARHILLVVDEASGVDEKIFEAAEGFLTAEGAHLLLLGNPTRIGGQFHRAFTTERAAWHTIHVSTFDTPNYTGEPVPQEVARSLPRKGWAEEKRKAWGELSPMYQVRVLGNFPSAAADAVIPLHTIEAAQARDLPADPRKDLIVIGCDVATYGDDETVICTRIGDQARITDRWVTPPQGQLAIPYTVGRLIEHGRSFDAWGAVRYVIDAQGVGEGVAETLIERLREDPFSEMVQVYPFKASQRAFDDEQFPNRRSEAWFVLADRILEIDLDGDEQLAADLSSPTYKLNSRGQRQVEPKDDTKKRLGRSPDRADALILCFQGDGAGVIHEERRMARKPQWGDVPPELQPLDDVNFMLEQW